jgi:hypothetical protein
MNEEEEQIQRVPAWRRTDGTCQILCPNCCQLHNHGKGDGERCPHCADHVPADDRRSYTLVTVGHPGDPIPAEALVFNHAARRLMSRIYYRQGRYGKSDPGVKRILADLDRLRAGVRTFNENILHMVQGEEGNRSENNCSIGDYRGKHYPPSIPQRACFRKRRPGYR